MPQSPRYFLLFKPYGYLSQFSTSHRKKKLLGDLYQFPPGVQPIGRLDEDSEGLLLLTDDKAMHQRLLGHEVEKEYWVEVDGVPAEENLRRLEEGVSIQIKSQPYITRPCRAGFIAPPAGLAPRIPRVRYHKSRPAQWLSLVLLEGKNRQVRRMTAAIGHPTLRLLRIRIGNLCIDQMQAAEVRELQRDEIAF